MKKLAFGLLIASLLIIPAMAEQGQLAWNFLVGVYDSDATDLSLATGTDAILNNYDVTWQLIWAGADGTINSVDINNAANGYVGGDDVVLATRIVTQSDRTSLGFDEYLYSPSGNLWDWFDPAVSQPAMVYQRVFQITPGGDVEVGTWYYDTGLFDASGVAPMMPAVTFSADYAESLGDNPHGVQPNQQVMGSQVIPEPATMSLLGLGALAMALRRKLRK